MRGSHHRDTQPKTPKVKNPLSKIHQHSTCKECGKEFDFDNVLGNGKSLIKLFCSLECSRNGYTRSKGYQTKESEKIKEPYYAYWKTRPHIDKIY